MYSSYFAQRFSTNALLSSPQQQNCKYTFNLIENNINVFYKWT
jgi:hypothetical protein